MIASGNQNQFPSSFAPFGDLFKALMFLSNLNGFNSSPSPLDQGFAKRKCFSKVWKEKGSKWLCHFSLFLLLVFMFALLECFAFLFWVSLVLYTILFNMFLFVYFSVLLYFVFHKNFKKKYKKKKKMCGCVHWYLCTLNGHWNKVF